MDSETLKDFESLIDKKLAPIIAKLDETNHMMKSLTSSSTSKTMRVFTTTCPE